MSNILILGKGGQLSRALANLLGDKAITVSRKEADFAAADFISQLDKATQGKTFTAVINAAAYTQVDKAEEEPKLAIRINGEAVGELAVWCKEKKLPLVHISTDYVFDGNGISLRKETDSTAPLNTYGKSKLAGEGAIGRAGGKALVFRTSWLYDAEGKNFYTTMLRLFKEMKSLNVVSDQVGAPTYVPHLAQAILQGLAAAQKQPDFPSGIYHLCSGGEASWHAFASAILALATTRDSAIICSRIKPIPSSEYKTPARRPANSRLDCSKAFATLGVRLPHWQEGLEECIGQTYGRDGMQDKRA